MNSERGIVKSEWCSSTSSGRQPFGFVQDDEAYTGFALLHIVYILNEREVFYKLPLAAITCSLKIAAIAYAPASDYSYTPKYQLR